MVLLASMKVLILQAAAPTLDEDEKALQQSEIDAYNKLKEDLQLWTLAFSFLGLSCTWALTSQVKPIPKFLHSVCLLIML